MTNLQQLLDKIDETAHELFTGDFSLPEVFEFLIALIHAAEEVIPGRKTGEEKKALVLGAWEHYNDKYDLVKALDGAVKAGIFEPFDSLIIEKGIGLLIDLVVTALNWVGWGK